MERGLINHELTLLRRPLEIEKRPQEDRNNISESKSKTGVPEFIDGKELVTNIKM